ncbi:MAG: helix-turn-helix transcriptional regulator [Candidatus Omnitrophica bacterium]|nr:helix-turn-helix transcriptional regulator [Candidatus Omnitrophota bacterium]MDD5351712.1 helix-turn-helix transcriptional regulator [Candidatus Omnitrophota bacterium]MDD5550922.1 helix-turn-helix transcriptional regulator [Candidatus Omnitrophota bacterium]
MPGILKQFGKKVLYYRKGKKFSQEKLAKLACLHRTYISQIEIGKRNIALRNIAKLAKALGVSPKDLLK